MGDRSEQRGGTLARAAGELVHVGFPRMGRTASTVSGPARARAAAAAAAPPASPLTHAQRTVSLGKNLREGVKLLETDEGGRLLAVAAATAVGAGDAYRTNEGSVEQAPDPTLAQRVTRHFRADSWRGDRPGQSNSSMNWAGSAGLNIKPERIQKARGQSGWVGGAEGGKGRRKRKSRTRRKSRVKRQSKRRSTSRKKRKYRSRISTRR